MTITRIQSLNFSEIAAGDAVPASEAREFFVMANHDGSISGAVQIRFNHVGFLRDREFERGLGIFRSVTRGTSMGDHQRSLRSRHPYP